MVEQGRKMSGVVGESSHVHWGGTAAVCENISLFSLCCGLAIHHLQHEVVTKL